MNKKGRYIEITIHALVWVVLYFLPFVFSIGSDIDLRHLTVHFWLHLTLIGVIFYVNYSYLVDNVLFKSPYRAIFFVANLCLLVGVITLKSQLYFHLLPTDGERGHRPPRQLAWYMDFLAYLIPVAVSVALKTGNKALKVETLKAEAENMRLQSELQHLKFQFQPHFVFNALNNVYALIEVDPAKAQQSLHSLSRLMRHLMKSSEDVTITLEEEMDFLLKYIDVMQLRLPPQVTLEVDFPEKVPPVRVVPLLFITLVENAFKHGIAAGKPSRIRFGLRILESHSIRFSSSNPFFPKQEEDLSHSGIGLVNLRKRLGILYPERFKLEDYVLENHYFVQLEIPVIITNE